MTDPTALYYALSTIAKYAAALVALIGFLGKEKGDLRAMARLNPAATWDVRRFRPNLVIATDDRMVGTVEAAWHGRTLRLGELVVRCEMSTARGAMTIQAQADLPKDPMVRTIVREAGQHLGIDATVLQSGRVAVGDVVEL
jgi:uncharacterized protein YcbX